MEKNYNSWRIWTNTNHIIYNKIWAFFEKVAILESGVLGRRKCILWSTKKKERKKEKSKKKERKGVRKEEKTFWVRKFLNCNSTALVFWKRVWETVFNTFFFFRGLDVIMHLCVLGWCPVWLFETPWTGAHQAPLSLGFSGQECWSGLPYPPPGDLPHPGIEPASPVFPALQTASSPTESPGKPLDVIIIRTNSNVIV